MIKITRPECPEILKIGKEPPSKGQLETQANIDALRQPRVTSRQPQVAGEKQRTLTYKVYTDKTVREALKKMTHGKCAYCESRIIAIYSGDIEHFRPKGGGYFWLAADWENLLFACPFCNQTHTHRIAGDGTVRETVQGKRDQFPLVRGAFALSNAVGELFFSDKVTYDAAFNREESGRLLLRPCTDANVESFFKYDNQGLLLVADGLNPHDHLKAETSIMVYALQRLGLVQAREAKVIQIRAQIRRVENAIDNLNTYYHHPEEERSWFEGILREEMEVLRRYQDADQEYAGLARYIIQQYFNDFAR